MIVVIPAYKPSEELILFIKRILLENNDVIVVDDGSEVNKLFEKIASLDSKKLHVLHHAINLGKGRSLKTAFNYVLLNYRQERQEKSIEHTTEPVGIITADADGQHSLEDIRLVSKVLEENPHHLVLGCRNFKGHEVPLRNKIGNTITRCVCQYLCGLKLSDTQTGLRGIPIDALKTFLQTPGERYEYEMNMLLDCPLPVKEVPISTIYHQKGDYITHFNPLWDSVAIYRVILAYSLSSVFATVVDFIVFSSAILSGVGIWSATAMARLSSAVINFFVNQKAVFHSEGKNQFVKYSFLVIVSGFLSASLISTLRRSSKASIVLIKIVVELFLFFFNYYVQRVFIFGRKNSQAVTDWYRYYQQGRSWFSTFTQRFTLSRILEAIEKYPPPIQTNRDYYSICELGGGNSCFCEQLCGAVKNITRYDIVDNNPLAVEMFEKLSVPVPHKGFCKDLLSISRINEILTSVEKAERAEHKQLRREQSQQSHQNQSQHTQKYDFVFSIGLIEHFRGKDIQTLIKRHFEFCKDGGLVLISFPTPTKKYRFVRRCMELLGCWQFHDEKPIRYSEVEKYFKKYGTVLEHYINYKLPLTQEIVIVRKNDQN